VKLQTQIAERATSEAGRAEAFAQLKRGIDRATHLVEQLLNLARGARSTSKWQREAMERAW
jgi:hypothetical protein